MYTYTCTMFYLWESSIYTHNKVQFAFNNLAFCFSVEFIYVLTSYGKLKYFYTGYLGALMAKKHK